MTSQPPADPATYRWRRGGFLAAELVDDLVLVADSWLVVDGSVLAMERHRRRFLAGVAEVVGDVSAAEAALTVAAGLVPHLGRWSPRLDLTAAGLQLRVRPAPAAHHSTIVLTAEDDPRTFPLRKGPDLVALGQLQRNVIDQLGAGAEAIVTDRQGRVAEGAFSALLWWRGDALCAPQATRLPSVTAAVITDLARHDGVELRTLQARPDELAGAEVWLVNALRGIRPVRAWLDGPEVAVPTRATAWQARLESLRRPWVLSDEARPRAQ